MKMSQEDSFLKGIDFDDLFESEIDFNFLDENLLISES